MYAKQEMHTIQRPEVDWRTAFVRSFVNSYSDKGTWHVSLLKEITFSFQFSERLDREFYRSLFSRRSVTVYVFSCRHPETSIISTFKLKKTLGWRFVLKMA
jgi:hypothetical protein